jgi:predicted TIM-barrel fold metal-dependent hydrolase
VANAENTLNFTALHGQGIRAARFSHRSGAGTNFVGSASMDDFESLKSTLANANLHAEVWTDCVALQDIDRILMSSPVPIVIDHMGGFNPQRGINDQGFQKLLRLLDTGHVWIKLCVYRNLLNEADYDIGKPFMEAMIKQNPDRLVWGSDWPHLRVLPTPNTPDLLDLLKQWAPDELALEKILTTNPSELYN